MKLVSKNNGFIKKTLPVSYPMITTYTQHAHLLSILSCYEQTYPWIFSNYIQLYINKDYKHNWGDFYFPFPYELRPSDTCKWIHSQKIHRDNIDNKWGSVIDFIVECINLNNYVHTMINYFYVPLSQRYHKDNLHHDIFVYGFDLNEEILYVSDFFKAGKYSFETISFSDFTQAFSTYNLTENPDYLNEMVYLYKFYNECDYKFSIKNITNSIRSYLFSVTPEYWDIYNRDNRENIVFGVEIYTTLKNYITDKVSDDESEIDIRPFYLLYDHKKIMSLRLKYLHEKGYFKNHNNDDNIIRLGEIETQTRILLNIIIKYNITKKSILINRAVNMLNDIEKKEYQILKQYI